MASISFPTCTTTEEIRKNGATWLYAKKCSGLHLLRSIAKGLYPELLSEVGPDDDLEVVRVNRDYSRGETRITETEVFSCSGWSIEDCL